MQELLIDSIRTDGGTQSRLKIDDAYVQDLADLLKAGKKLPPVEVFNDGSENWMADGFHRILAHVRTGKRNIRCNVHKGGQTDAAWASCAANQEHGLRRTNLDKRRAVELALKTKSNLSDRAIAEHVGVGADIVGSVRRQVSVTDTSTSKTPAKEGFSEKAHIPPPRVGLDGKTYPARRIPPPPAPGSARRPPPPEPIQKGPMDKVGTPIPDHLQPLFDRAPEVEVILAQISSVKSAISRANESGDALFQDVDFNAALAGLQNAYDAIKATTPYAVCPWCKGTLSESCRGCAKRGVLGKFRYDTTVPRELKK